MIPAPTKNAKRLIAQYVVAATLAGAGLTLPAMAQEGITIPAPAVDQSASPARSEVAVVAGGCFWGIQGVFQHVTGVKNAVSGYAGGSAGTAQYHTVGTGSTGHAESVQITFDPSQISSGEILHIFFSVAHDPTQLNRQGPDTGTQYRTAIFPQNGEQAKIAEAYIDQLNAAKVFRRKIATTIEPGKAFYPAEGYHQNYLTLHPNQPYIVYNDLPKLGHLTSLLPSRYRAAPVLVSGAAGG